MVKEREVTIGLLNGMYKMLTAGDYDLITENIYKCPMKVADPLVRAILGYGYLMPDATLKVLLNCFGIYKMYFQQVKTDEELNKMVEEADQIAHSMTNELENKYAVKVMAAFIDEIELAYKQSKETVNTNTAA